MRRLIRGLALLALAACGDNAGPSPSPSPRTLSQLHVLLQRAGAPPLVAASDSFWAKVGQSSRLRLLYQGATSTDTSQELLRFEVDQNSLLTKPNGTPFAPGDSILIKVTVIQQDSLILDFEPTGIQFNPNDPAKLKIYYYNANHDFNGDGVVDAKDDSIEALIDLWKREPPDTLWFKQGALKFESQDQLEAKILSFTDHAVAW